MPYGNPERNKTSPDTMIGKLSDAISGKDDERVRLILSREPCLAEATLFGKHLVFSAIANGIGLAPFAEAGCRIDITNKGGESLMDVLVRLDKGEDLISFGDTRKHLRHIMLGAAKNNSTRVLLSLMRRFPDTGITDDNGMPLPVIVVSGLRSTVSLGKNNTSDVLKFLDLWISNGGSLHRPDGEIRTALFEAEAFWNFPWGAEFACAVKSLCERSLLTDKHKSGGDKNEDPEITRPVL